MPNRRLTILALLLFAWSAQPRAAETPQSVLVGLLETHHLARQSLDLDWVAGTDFASLGGALAERLPFTEWQDRKALERVARAGARARLFGLLFIEAPSGVVVLPRQPGRQLTGGRLLHFLENVPVDGLAMIIALLADHSADELSLDVGPLEGRGPTETLRLPALGAPPPAIEARERDGAAGWAAAGLLVLSIDRFVSGRSRMVLERLLAPPTPPATRVILDLRWAAGGDLPAALDLLSVLLPEEFIAGRPEPPLRGRDFLRTTARGQLADAALVVLTSPWTASAAEIVAQALRERQHTLLLGRQTRGKCIVQQVFDLDLGTIAIPVSRIGRADGTAGCHQRGVTPHVELPVALVADDLAVSALARVFLHRPLHFACLEQPITDPTAAGESSPSPGLDRLLLRSEDGAGWLDCLGPLASAAGLEQLKRRLPAGRRWNRLMTWPIVERQVSNPAP